MKTSFRKLFLAPLVVLVLASFALTPMDAAVRSAGAGAGVVALALAPAVAVVAVVPPGRTCNPTTAGPMRAPTMNAAAASTMST